MLTLAQPGVPTMPSITEDAVTLAPGAVMFLVIVLAAWAFAKVRFNAGFVLLVLWALVYPWIGVRIVMMFSGGPSAYYLGLGVPSLISAVLLCAATRSPWPAAGVLVGWGASASLLETIEELPSMGIWNAPIAFAMAAWAVSAHRAAVLRAASQRGVDRCPACGYDLSGLRTRNCPECGGTAHPSAPPPFRDPGHTP